MQPSLKNDTGWINCSLELGIENIDWNPLQYRLIDNICYICGAVRISNPLFGKVITRLPYKFEKEFDSLSRNADSKDRASIISLNSNGDLDFLDYIVNNVQTTDIVTVFINISAPIKK